MISITLFRDLILDHCILFWLHVFNRPSPKMLNVEAGFVANILVLPDLVVLFLISALFCLFGILCYMNCFVGGIF
jgi:hypothetical protein